LKRFGTAGNLLKTISLNNPF